MLKRFTAICVLVFNLFNSVSAQEEMGPLTIHPENNRYFANSKGEIVYLTGAHNWHVLINDSTAPLSHIEYLNYLKVHNLNFLRLWANLGLVWNRAGIYERKAKYRTPTIYQRTGPGHATDGENKFNLTKFNDEYLLKLKQIIEAAKERGIYVSIMLFEGWWNSESSFRDDAWYGHPFNPLNNVNNLNITTAGIHTLKDSSVVALQKLYVQHIVENVNTYDNILFEISNEDKMSTNKWQLKMLNVIRSVESALPNKHPVWITSKSWGTSDNWIWKSSAEAISPTWITSWNNPDEPYLINPPVADGSKVIILDTDHFLGGDEFDWRRMVLKAFFRGYNPIVMDPYLNHPTWKLDSTIILAAGCTNYFAKSIDLARMIPIDNLNDCSTEYCLRNQSIELLIYQPSPSPFSVSLETGDYSFEWIDPVLHDIKQSGVVKVASGNRIFQIPDTINDDAVLHLKLLTHK